METLRTLLLFVHEIPQENPENTFLMHTIGVTELHAWCAVPSWSKVAVTAFERMQWQMYFIKPCFNRKESNPWLSALWLDGSRIWMFYQKFSKQAGTCQQLSSSSVKKQKNVGVFEFEPYTWALRVYKQMWIFFPHFGTGSHYESSLDILNTWHGAGWWTWMHQDTSFFLSSWPPYFCLPRVFFNVSCYSVQKSIRKTFRYSNNFAFLGTRYVHCYYNWISAVQN